MKQRLITWLKWSEQYTKTDMVYLASGTFWSQVNGVLMAALTFTGSVFFAKYLTKEAYGNYQYLLSIGSLIGSLTLSYGMNNAVTRAVARGYDGELPRSIRYQLIGGIIPTVVGLCVSAYYLIHQNYEIGTALILISILLPLGNAYNTWAALPGGKRMFRVGTYFGMCNNILSYSAILLTIFFARDYVWVAIANYLGLFLSNFLMYKLVMRKIPHNDKLDTESMPYGIHLSLMVIPGVIAAQFDNLLIFHYVGAATLAVYTFATIIPEKLIGFIKFIPNLVLVRLSSRNEVDTKNFLARKLWIMIAFTIVCAAGYAFTAPFLFKIFFPQYLESIQFTQVYALSFFSLVVTILQSTLLAQKKTKELYVLGFVTPVVRIALLALLMYFYGIWGLLWAQITLNFFTFALQLILVYRPVRQPAVS